MTNHDDTLLQFLAAAEALLAAHADDIKLHGAARPRAHCEFAQRAHGALAEACERIRELVAEVERLHRDEMARVVHLEADLCKGY